MAVNAETIEANLQIEIRAEKHLTNGWQVFDKITGRRYYVAKHTTTETISQTLDVFMSAVSLPFVLISAIETLSFLALDIRYRSRRQLVIAGRRVFGRTRSGSIRRLLLLALGEERASKVLFRRKRRTNRPTRNGSHLDRNVRRRIGDQQNRRYQEYSFEGDRREGEYASDCRFGERTLTVSYPASQLASGRISSNVHVLDLADHRSR